MAIPILTRKEETEVKKQIRAYNRKINRLSKEKKYQGVVLPATLDVNQTILNLSNRYELRRLINQVGRFLKPQAGRIITNKQGVSTIAFVREQARLDQQAANRRNAKIYKELASIPVSAGGRDTGRTVEQLSPESLTQYLPRKFNFDRYRAPGELQRRVLNLAEQSKEIHRRLTDQLWKDNFILAAERELGVYAQPIVDLVNTIPADNFGKMLLADEDLAIRYIYSTEEIVQKQQEILAHLQRGIQKFNDT